MEKCPKQYEINEICRCCLKNIGKMRPLYGFSLNEMLRSVTNLDVEPNDGFPELLCFQCVLQLSRAYRFKEQCLKSHKIILDYIEEKRTQKDIYETAFVENVFPITDENSHPDENSISPHDEDSKGRVEEFDRDSCKEDILNHLGNIPEVDNKSAYRCDTCYKQFISRKQLNRHTKTHNDNKPYKCSECDKTFAEKCNLNKHLFKHNGELRKSTKKVYLCSICGKNFKYSSSLAKHMKFHTGKNLLYCPHCLKCFAEKSALDIHQRVHTGDRPYICHHCNRKFTQLCNLRKHLRSHDTERLYACSICKRTFVDCSYVALHMQTHSLDKKSLCSTCGKRFANNKTLQAHMRVHDEKRLFDCGFENCMKKFSRLDTALIHRRIHSGERPYSCEICNQLFTTSTQLSVHLQSHSGEKSFACEVCQKQFASKSGLRKHTVRHKEVTATDVNIQKNEERDPLNEDEACKNSVANHVLEESMLLFNVHQRSELVSETELASLAENIHK